MNNVQISASIAACLHTWDSPLMHTSGGGKQIHPSVCPRGGRQAVPAPVPAPPQHQPGGSTVRRDQFGHAPLFQPASAPRRWRWRIPTWAASRSSPRPRTWTACCSPETCSSSPCGTGTTCARWSSASPSASGGRDGGSVTVKRCQI